MKHTSYKIWLLLIVATVLGCNESSDVDESTESDTADSDTDSDSDTDADFDCDNLPEPPYNITQHPTGIAGEDLAFDADGNVIGSNQTAIFKTPYDGEPVVWVPNTNFRAGLRYLPNGHLVYADDNQNRLVRVDPDGVQHTVVSGLSYPNGIAVDPNGWVYVTNHNAGQIWRIDGMTGEYTIIASGLSCPNGITFNATYDVLYFAEFGGYYGTTDGDVYKLPIDEDGNTGELTKLVENVGSGALDGMGVDICGNVYVCDYVCEGEVDDTCIYRIAPDGSSVVKVIDTDWHQYIPNMQWGSGIGGWAEDKLYLSGGWNAHVFEVDLGIPGKPRVYP